MNQESRSPSRLTNWGKERIPSPRIQERPGYMVDLTEDPGWCLGEWVEILWLVISIQSSGLVSVGTETGFN